MRQSGSASSRALLAGLIIIAAGAAGFLVSQQADRPGASATVAQASPSHQTAEAGAAASEAPPADEARPAGKSIPDTLPDITLADKDGKPTKLSSFGGRSLMVNFWATWCAPCRREIPLLNRLRDERKAENAEIVGIAVDFRDKVLEFVQQVPLSYPLLIGEEDGLAAAEAFGMGMAFPFSVFVDSQNRILTVKIGELHEDEANFVFDRLRDIDQGKLARAVAQQLVADALREMAARRAKNAAGKPDNPAN